MAPVEPPTKRVRTSATASITIATASTSIIAHTTTSATFTSAASKIIAAFVAVSIPSSAKAPNLEHILIGLAKSLHDDQPNHPIFGEPTAGKIRLPYKAERKNGQCWKKIMAKIADWVLDEIGDNWAPENCWMSNKAQIQITRASEAHNVNVFASITVCRLLAFFADPTLDHWKCLSEQSNAENTPFDH